MRTLWGAVVASLLIGAGLSPSAATTEPTPGAPARSAPAPEPGPDPDLRDLTRPDDRVLAQEQLVSAVRRAPRELRVLVQPVRWGRQQANLTVAEIDKVILDDTAAWFSRVSAGRHRLSGKVARWAKLSGGNCYDLDRLYRAAAQKAKAAGIAVGTFDRFVVYLPNCRGSSYGQLPGKVTWLARSGMTVPVAAHELGHNLGLDHAYGLLCGPGGARVTIRPTCAKEEYGDLYDAMGISAGSYAVPTLVRLGWARKVQTLTGSGTVDLAPMERPGTGLQGVRIKVTDRLSYWLEYRTDVTVADLESPAGAAGVQVRMVKRGRQYLLDGAPGDVDQWYWFPDPDVARPRLAPGTSFTTPEGIRIETVSVGDTEARVRVTRGYTPRPPTVPTVTAAIAGEYETHVRWTPPADDRGSQVSQYRIRNEAGRVVTAAPWQTEKSWDAFVAVGGTVQVQAVNAIGASEWSPPVPAISAGPSVEITSPAPGAVVGNTFQVEVLATPNPVTGSPVESVQFWVDCRECWSDHVDTTAPFTYEAQIYHPYEHTVWVEAYDADGEYAAASVVVDGSAYEEPRIEVVAPARGATVGAQFDLVLDVVAVPAGLDRLSIDVGWETVSVEGDLGDRVVVPIDLTELHGPSPAAGRYDISAYGDNDVGDYVYSEQTYVIYRP